MTHLFPPYHMNITGYESEDSSAEEIEANSAGKMHIYCLLVNLYFITWTIFHAFWYHALCFIIKQLKVFCTCYKLSLSLDSNDVLFVSDKFSASFPIFLKLCYIESLGLKLFLFDISSAVMVNIVYNTGNCFSSNLWFLLLFFSRGI